MGKLVELVVEKAVAVETKSADAVSDVLGSLAMGNVLTSGFANN